MTQNKHVNLLLEVLGCFVSAAGIYSFAVASGVPVTGVAGVCAILYRLFGIPMGLSNVLINIPVILILGNKGVAVLKDYMRQRKEGKTPEFHAADIGITGTDYWN